MLVGLAGPRLGLVVPDLDAIADRAPSGSKKPKLALIDSRAASFSGSVRREGGVCCSVWPCLIVHKWYEQHDVG